MASEKFYITTSIPYLNGPSHIGHALEFVQADAIARYQRIIRKEVFFLTGSDEHGATIVKAAEKTGKNPDEFVNSLVVVFRKLLNSLHISNDDFIRTSDKKRHWPGAKLLWQKLVESGDIYKGFYKGLYCIGHEAYVTEKDLENGLCVLHKTPPEEIQEENYFFKLSKYTSAIREKITSGELKILPEFRSQETINALTEIGDISFSRPQKDISWGIPVPGDDTQTMYVWCDALSNYISALGFGSSDDSKFKQYWPADVQVIGKDILKFHAIFWPAMLLSAGLPLPRTIFVHGFINMKGEKMSKTVGNVMDPFPLIEKYGADAVRFYLLHEVATFGDSDYSDEHFHEVYNGSLVNGLGNLVSRVTKMVENVGGVEKDEEDQGLKAMKDSYHRRMKNYEIGEAIRFVWKMLHEMDEYIEQHKIYKLVKENPEDAKKKLGSSNLFIGLETIAELITPFLPETAEKMHLALKNPSERVHLFPRIEK